MDKNFDIYPLTITKDRYTGVYSGGEWTAWYCDADKVPPEIASDDVTCCDFWSIAHGTHVSKLGYVKFMFNGDDFQCPVFGVGGTIEAAVADLKRRLENA